MIKLNLHSIIDVITNSSTEIFTFATRDAVEKSFELLNEVLKISGSDKKAEDLFNITIMPDWSRIRELCIGEEEPEDVIGYDKYNDSEKELINKMISIEDWNEKQEYFEKNIKEIILKYKAYEDLDDEIETFVCIEAKDKSMSDKDIWDMFFNTFHQKASYNS